MNITILAGDFGRDYEVSNGREAVKAFFSEIRANKIKLCQLSPLGSWDSGGEPIMFRIAPALFLAGLLTFEEYDGTLRQADADLDFTKEQLTEMAQADSWMLQ